MSELSIEYEKHIKFNFYQTKIKIIFQDIIFYFDQVKHMMYYKSQLLTFLPDDKSHLFLD